jgi:hypothetical protein
MQIQTANTENTTTQDTGIKFYSIWKNGNRITDCFSLRHAKSILKKLNDASCEIVTETETHVA